MSRTPARMKVEDALKIARGYVPGLPPLTERERAQKNADRIAAKVGPQAAWTPPTTFIYFLRSGEFVKIGHSRRWKVRMKHMQIGSPHTIVPLLVLKGRASLEQKLHARFKADHYRGEWFHLGPAVRAFIKENRKNCLANDAESEIPELEIIP